MRDGVGENKKSRHDEVVVAAKLDWRRLASLFAQAPSFMAITSGPEHIYEIANAAHQELIGNRNVIGKSVLEAMPELAAQGIIEALDAVYRSGEPRIYQETRLTLGATRDQASTEVFLDFVHQPIVDDDGLVVGIFIQGHDVTARVEAQRQRDEMHIKLVATSKQSGMDAMSATLAHELNQPLAIIANTVRAARRFLAAPTSNSVQLAAEALADVEEAALSAGELIRRLRDTVKRGHVRNRLENLAEMVADAVALTQSRMAANKITCRCNMPRDITVSGDRVQLQQVLLNLINNSIDALLEVPERIISISAVIESALVTVRITDTGPATTAEAAERMFDLFYTTKEQGLGLGLGICRTILEAHGGSIWCEKNDVTGVSFLFTLPRGKLLP